MNSTSGDAGVGVRAERMRPEVSGRPTVATDPPEQRHESVKDRILRAALHCLEGGGVGAVTVRNVTEIAGVNGASVNYYFGSKDNLLHQVWCRCLNRRFIEPLRTLDGLLGGRDKPRAAVSAFLKRYLREASREAHALDACLHGALTRQDYSGEILPAIREFLEGFLRRVQPILKPGGDAELRAAVIQIWSSILLVGMLPRGFEGFLGSSLSEGDVIDRYVDRLMEHYFLPE